MSLLPIDSDVPLAPMTTLELGGAAEHFVEAGSVASLVEALAWADEHAMPLHVLGGGSNVIVPDAGVPGLVVRLGLEEVSITSEGEGTIVRAEAGVEWDALVERSVSEGLAGLECLSGIPGSVGATPIQNVGAYGQEVADTLVAVEAIDRRTSSPVELSADQCEFAYRDSVFKRAPGRYIVTAVRFALRPGGAPTIRYPELRRAVGEEASLLEVRERVIALRRKKSMVIDPADPNRRSAGSFFTNPIVSDEEADRVVALAVSAGIVAGASDVPRYPAGEGESKLAAGWLIERAGIDKGLREGNVGVSSAHALGLVHHGGGTTAELLAFAEKVRAAVRGRFGVELEREPVLFGVA